GGAGRQRSRRGVRAPGCGRARGDRRRSALRRYGAFWPRADPPRLVLFRIPLSAPELFRAGRPATREPGDVAESLLLPGAGLGGVPARRARLGRDRYRLAGSHLGCVLAEPPGGTARLSAAPIC